MMVLVLTTAASSKRLMAKATSSVSIMERCALPEAMAFKGGFAGSCHQLDVGQLEKQCVEEGGQANHRRAGFFGVSSSI